MYNQSRGNRGRYDRDRNDSGYSRKQLHYSPNLLSAINNVIENQRMVSIEYDSREKGITQRVAEPMTIIYRHGKRHLVGYCHLRNDYRSFRLDRINTIRVNMETFQPRQDFDIARIESQMDQEQPYHDDEEDEFEEPDFE